MEGVEKIGLLPVSVWMDAVHSPGSNFTGIQPSDIGVLGPIQVGDATLFMMACDEHMTSEQGSTDPIYDLAIEYDRINDRVSRAIKLMGSAEYQAKYNTPTKQQKAKRIAEDNARLVEMGNHPEFLLSMRVNGCRKFFIENAVWTEVP